MYKTLVEEGNHQVHPHPSVCNSEDNIKKQLTNLFCCTVLTCAAWAWMVLFLSVRGSPWRTTAWHTAPPPPLSAPVTVGVDMHVQLTLFPRLCLTVWGIIVFILITSITTCSFGFRFVFCSHDRRRPMSWPRAPPSNTTIRFSTEHSTAIESNLITLEVGTKKITGSIDLKLQKEGSKSAS